MEEYFGYLGRGVRYFFRDVENSCKHRRCSLASYLSLFPSNRFRGGELMAGRFECSVANNVPVRAYNLPACCRQRLAKRVIATLYGPLRGSFPRPMWPRRASAYDLLASEIASTILTTTSPLHAPQREFLHRSYHVFFANAPCF